MKVRMALFKTLSLGVTLLLSFLPRPLLAQPDSLRMEIEQVIDSAIGDVGVAVLDLEDGDTQTVNGHLHFPLQSVYKFPLALAVFHQIDKGNLSLAQKIHIKREDLRPDTWSPLSSTYPNGNVDITLSELLRYTVSESDNNGCDILFRLLGGTTVVEKFVHSLGIQDIAIAATEEEMARDWEVQFTNWSSPTAMAELLRMFFHDSVLSRRSKDTLWGMMVGTTTGPARIKGLLPTGTVVAHKTGSSGTNSAGIAAATNDVGIVTLPNGKHIAIVVFVTNSSGVDRTRDLVIARIARAAWDAYVK